MDIVGNLGLCCRCTISSCRLDSISFSIRFAPLPSYRLMWFQNAKRHIPLDSHEKYKNDTHQFHEFQHRTSIFCTIFWFICKTVPFPPRVFCSFKFISVTINFMAFGNAWKKKQQSRFLFILCPNLSQENIHIFTMFFFVCRSI